MRMYWRCRLRHAAYRPAGWFLAGLETAFLCGVYRHGRLVQQLQYRSTPLARRASRGLCPEGRGQAEQDHGKTELSGAGESPAVVL